MLAQSLLAPITLAVLLTGCATDGLLRKPAVKNVVPKIESIDLEGVSLAFEIGVENPYPVPLAAPRFDYGVEAMNKTLAAGEMTEGIRLPASGVGRFTLPVRISYRQAYEIARGLEEVNRVEYTLRGRLHAPELKGLGEGIGSELAGGARELSVPIVYHGSFPILRAPVFTAVNLAPLDFSATKVSVSAKTEVLNQNEFGIDLSGLQFDMKLDGVTLGRLTATSNGEEIPPDGKAEIQIKGQVSAVDTIKSLFNRGGPAAMGIDLEPVGGFKTPYGIVAFVRDEK